MDKCQATTKAGNPCKRKPLPGSDYCSSHKPKDELLFPTHHGLEPEPVPEAPTVCGHQNVHYTDGELLCDQPPGHDGLHSAVYYAVDYRDGGIAFEGERRTYWSDAAGIPVEEIKPDIEGLKKELLERKMKEMLSRA